MKIALVLAFLLPFHLVSNAQTASKEKTPIKVSRVVIDIEEGTILGQQSSMYVDKPIRFENTDKS